MEKLKETSEKFPQTQIWNDSCSISELKYAVERGAVGATTNPVIVLQVLKNELPAWESTIESLILEDPEASEDEIAWKLIREMGFQASQILLPVFEESNGLRGRISLQTNAKFFNNKTKIITHAMELAAVAPNTQIKAPASQAGIEAFEELTFLGISINATVSFTVSQAIAVAEAVERGLKRRKAAGLSNDRLNPVCTIMVGRLDDALKADVKKNQVKINPEVLEFAGIAVFKKAYQIYQERKYTTKLLVAAFRNQEHWTEMIGGDLVLTIPYKWQVSFNSADVDILDRIHQPIDKSIIEELNTLVDFRKAYEPDGLALQDFQRFAPFVATINQFLNGYDELVQLIRTYFFKNQGAE